MHTWPSPTSFFESETRQRPFSRDGCSAPKKSQPQCFLQATAAFFDPKQRSRPGKDTACWTGIVSAGSVYPL